jgi:hypothetical protein
MGWQSERCRCRLRSASEEYYPENSTTHLFHSYMRVNSEPPNRHFPILRHDLLRLTAMGPHAHL